MKTLRHLLSLSALTALGCTTAFGQTAVDYQKYPDYSPRILADYTLLKPQATTAEERPAMVDNSATIYFPPIFAQVGGSCGSASRIGYMFTYEINRLRNLDAGQKENRYPTHFTWLLTNNGSNKETMAIANGIPNVITYGGEYTSDLFGIQEDTDIDYGWMQGYNKWFAAMHNRLERNANFPISVETEEGREAVKNWLWNHNGDPNYPGGGVCGIGVASSNMELDYLEADNAFVSNKISSRYVKQWGPQVDHALTIVGYDDRIVFDLDGNGVVGEKDKDEVGAWIIVNSWGPTWYGTGKFYCPYKNAVPSASSTDYYQPEIYYIRRNYRPLRTFKILMEYSHRSELKLSAGIATDINATEPEQTLEFEHFKFAGDGTNASPAPAVPMLGRWADGIHSEPMEFGYDLTDFSNRFDTSKPLKYFFIIESKPKAQGKGTIHSCSLMDYEFDRNGIETAFNVGKDGVSIKNAGEKTIISVVVKGEQVNAPRNVSMDTNGTLCWDTPAPSTFKLKGYDIYAGKDVLTRLAADQTSYTPETTAPLQIAAIYDYEGEEISSKRINVPNNSFYGVSPTTNKTRTFNTSGFRIKDIFRERYDQFTLEFWIRPQSASNYNQQIGPGWGQFLMHTTSTRQFIAGWDTSNRIMSANGALSINKWQHVAVVVDGNRMLAYINGNKIGEIAGGNRGIGGFGDLNFGTEDANALHGKFDEIRIWNTARTQREIQSMMYMEVADAANTPGLLAEFKMNEKANGTPSDETGRWTTERLNNGTQFQNTENIFNDRRELTADFTLPEAPYYTGTGIDVTNTSSANAISYVWTNSEEPQRKFNVEAPTFLFNTPGEKTITLTVADATGATQTTEKKLTVSTLPKPVASFNAPEGAPAGTHITLYNTTEPAEGCMFEWSMVGADNERATTSNASVCYQQPGEYTVTLKATNASGTSTCSKKIVVLNHAPEAKFSVSPAAMLKGGTAELKDESLYQPSTWLWNITDAAHHFVAHEANTTFQLNDPGVYDITLAVSNAVGSHQATQKRSIIVCNADSKNGLNFSGNAGESVTFNNPLNISASNGTATIEWWMYAKKNASPSHHIGGTAADLMLSTNADGGLNIYLGNKNFVSPAGFIIPSEWHHYGAVFTQGKDPLYQLDRVSIALYRDGAYFATVNVPGKWAAMPEKFSLGSDKAPMNAIIDEFRIWNAALTVEQLRSYANAPVPDVEAATTKHNLVLYYDFNQSGGDVIDRTTNGNTGVRKGFGPDGDAWPSSIGVFCLSDTKRTDISAEHLTNYKAPYLYTNTAVSTQAPQFKELLQDEETSRWIVENAVESGKTVTGINVDTENGDLLGITTKLYDFAAEVNDHKAYQVVTLPPGYYVFGITSANLDREQDSYLVAAKGEGLPLTDLLHAQSIAHQLLGDYEVEFALYEDTEVSLGLVLNSRGEQTQYFGDFFLEKKITNDDFLWTGIAPAATTEAAPDFTPVQGGIIVKSATPVNVRIYNLSGVCVHRSVVCGTSFVALPSGIYLVGGQKVLVR